jgi:hypothetical protein
MRKAALRETAMDPVMTWMVQVDWYLHSNITFLVAACAYMVFPPPNTPPVVLYRQIVFTIQSLETALPIPYFRFLPSHICLKQVLKKYDFFLTVRPCKALKVMYVRGVQTCFGGFWGKTSYRDVR